ncbi:MAG: alpha-hydroxy-acid oxidizing protein [Planctomycetota bacterium]|jgi:2-keto-3-deoxy-6-phosphogluconate aldolase|nr:alpha-hydroxy-acid oxidizing protein [Planctomycetota bacterium]
MPKSIDEHGCEKVAASGLDFTFVNKKPGNPSRLARECFDSLVVELRMINAVEASIETRLFGETFASPVMPAALSGLDRLRPGGLVDAADAAKAAGVPVWIGVGEEDELRRVVDTGAKAIKVLKPVRNTEAVLDWIGKAQRSGVMAVGMDVSFGFGMKNGYAPEPVRPQSLADLRAYVAATSLPFIVKGVLSVQDAQKALDAGAKGIVVSNQGGTVLDWTAPPLMVLPDIVKTVGARIPVFLDGGVAGGLDAYKAVALGADGVCVGGALLPALAAEGAAGVKKTLAAFSSELRRAVSMTGFSSLAAVDASALRSVSPWGGKFLVQCD